jgi:pyruvate-formate lyase-activating enzyme
MYGEENLNFMTVERLAKKYVPYVVDIIVHRWEITEAEAMDEIARWMSDMVGRRFEKKSSMIKL